MSIIRFETLAIALLSLSLLQAQPAPHFEVATLKVSPPPKTDLININLGTFRNGRLTLTNVTLKDAVKFAYELVSDDQLTAPAWNRSVRFDIEALAPPETPLAQIHLMTRALLAERLRLVVRREEKILRHLALVTTKGGPTIQPAKPGATLTPAGIQTRGHIAHNQMPISMLVTLLSRFERQTIIDQTGLNGQFEVKLEWSPDNAFPAEDPAAPPPERPSLFAAVQEQLGLKLEARRSPLEVLIVQQALKEPEGN